MDGGDLMIAMPHLLFLTVLFVAGLVAWALDFGRYPTSVILPGAVVAWLGAGIFLAAWV